MSQENQDSNALVIGDSPRNSTGLVRSSSTNVYQLPIERLSNADPSNVQQIAASQIELLSNYHQEVLNQAKKSFFWALVAAGAGFFFFLATLLFVIYPNDNKRTEFAVVSTVGGALIEVISAINFYLYGKASSQMADFQQRLDRTQRFLLANSICEGLKDEAKQKSRSDLIRVIAGISPVQGDIPLETKLAGEKEDQVKEEAK